MGFIGATAVSTAHIVAHAKTTPLFRSSSSSAFVRSLLIAVVIVIATMGVAASQFDQEFQDLKTQFQESHKQLQLPSASLSSFDDQHNQSQEAFKTFGIGFIIAVVVVIILFMCCCICLVVLIVKALNNRH